MPKHKKYLLAKLVEWQRRSTAIELEVVDKEPVDLVNEEAAKN